MRYVVCHRKDYLPLEQKKEIINTFGPSFESGEIDDILFCEGSDRFSFEVLDTSREKYTLFEPPDCETLEVFRKLIQKHKSEE